VSEPGFAGLEDYRDLQVSVGVRGSVSVGVSVREEKRYGHWLVVIGQWSMVICNL